MTATHLFEKYRPSRIADVVLLPRDREAFESIIAKGKAPHLLLVGPPGVGKTSVAMALATDMKWQVMRKNAAADTNVEAVRTEIADFALPHSTLPLSSMFEGYQEEGHHCVNLEDFDYVPTKAQAGLRGIMEDAAASGHCNFIMTANDGKKVDRAIRSRCAVFDFDYSEAEREIIKPLYRQRIAQILAAEGFEPDSEIIERLINKHFPDLRAILNDIQRHT